MDGATANEESMWQRTAWQTAHIMNVWITNKIKSTDELLGRNQPDEESLEDVLGLPMFGSKEEYKAHMNEREKKLSK